MALPIIPWPGGKRRLLKHLLPIFEKLEHRCYVEAFAGGAAVLFAREPALAEVLNDINGELVRLYRCVQHHLDELVRQFRWALTSRQMFEWAQIQHPDTLTDIQRAARFFYLQKLAFGSKVSGQSFGYAPSGFAGINLLRIEEDLSQAHLRLARVTIEHSDWPKLVERYDRPETAFYFDPPYWQTIGYGSEFGFEQYQALASAMSSMSGKAVLSINDHPEMRAVFQPFRMRRIAHSYTIAGGGKSKAAGELIYCNW
jgi:DNA adenine methylase